MKIQPNRIKITVARGLAIAVSLFVLSACAGVTPRSTVKVRLDDYLIVTPGPKDTFDTLAATYLKDASKGWMIAKFNELDKPVAGQDLVIPLKPFDLGGLTREGYQTVPILLYHRFSDTKTSRMIVKTSEFEAQMRYLKENGYTSISLDELMDFLDFKAPLPEKAVVITFDDGWRSIKDIALPILKKYGFKGTLFAYSDFIGGGKALSWDDLKELDKGIIDVQCHSKTHRNMTQVNENESFQEYFGNLQTEIDYCRDLLKSRTGKTCTYFAYPYGASNSLVVQMIRKEGYRAAFTVVRGSNPFFVDNYLINRSAIYGGWDLKRFTANLAVDNRGNK